MQQEEPNKYVKELTQEKYKYGFTTDVHTDVIEKGLNEDVIRLISEKKGEPDWMLEFRLKAYRHWLTLEMPTWAHLRIPEIDYQNISYYADPTKKKEGPKSMDEVDPELIKTFNKLGIPLEEQMALSGMAVDAVMDSVSVKTTFKETLMEKGIIFCSMSEAIREHPDLVQKYLGSVVPYRDNFFAALNSAVFSDGSFVYIPKGVRCPMELSTYFRINAQGTGQFERTLIVADDDAYVSYLEGCTAPMRDENQLHAAIVEIVVHDRAEVKYSTVQNWYPGDAEGKGGVYNFVTKRGICKGVDSKLSWTQVETGSAITWKYPSCILAGDNSVAEFYSVAVTNNCQQADTGTKMIHIGKNTRSTIVSKGISAGRSENSYRGLVRVSSKADNARNYSQCDSLLLGDKCGAHTFPYMDIHNTALRIEAEGLISLGLMRGTAEDAVAAGAMTLFMPHGLGHGMGLDVHDCEAIGERSFDFSEIAEQAAKSGTCIQRSTWRIEPGTVMTDEPGIYFIPALIDKCRAEGKYKGIVDYEALDAYRDFGGIRIEDDVIVTETGSRMIGGDKRIPITVDELEAVVGR